MVLGVTAERSCFSICCAILAKVEEARMVRVRMSIDKSVKDHVGVDARWKELLKHDMVVVVVERGRWMWV